MTDAAKAVTGIVPVAMGAGLIGHNLSYLRKKKKKSLLKLGVENVVGVSLIGATAQAGSW